MRAVPGPKSRSIFGEARRFLTDTLGTFQYLISYGDIVAFRLLNQRAYVINRPDLIHQVLVTDANIFQKDDLTRKALRPLLGDSLFVANGSRWRNKRLTLQKLFHQRALAAYMQTMIDLTSRTSNTWQPGQTLDLKAVMTRLALEIVAKCLFDTDEVDAVAEPIASNMQTMIEIITHNMRSIPLPAWLPTQNQRRSRAALGAINRAISTILTDVRSRSESNLSLISMLLTATTENGAPLTDIEIHDEAMTFFLAGYETTAALLTWAWYLIGSHPEVETKLQAEADSVLIDGTPSLEAIGKLEYAAAVVKETLRLFPPIWLNQRQATEATTLGGYPIPKGSSVFLPTYFTHRDPRYFDQPDVFRPERWLPTFPGEPDLERQLPKGAYYPFSLGPRICIGNNFAMMEATIVLAMLARRWRLVTSHTPVGLLAQAVLTPAAPISIQVKERKGVVEVNPAPVSV